MNGLGLDKLHVPFEQNHGVFQAVCLFILFVCMFFGLFTVCVEGGNRLHQSHTRFILLDSDPIVIYSPANEPQP